MPGWLQTLARGNPLTYQVDALRALMIQGGQSSIGLGVDFAVEAGVLLALISIGSWL
jgi:ABC-2 type transport system permease protein